MTSTSTRDLVSQPYKYGFVTEIETDKIAKGLSEEVVRLISAKKEEPDFCCSSGSRRSATGSPSKSLIGLPWVIPRSTTKTSFITRLPSSRRRRPASMRWIRSCWKPSTSSASR